MTLNTELRSLLSDLKEHGLLDKHPDLEKIVKLGHQHLQTKLDRRIDIYESQNRSMEVVRSVLQERQEEKQKKTHEAKPVVREIKCPSKMLDREALLEDLRNFK